MTDSIKQNDTEPYLDFAFTANGSPVDCSPYNVRFLMRDAGGQVIINKVVGTDAGAVWDNEAAGIGHYEWAEADTAVVGSRQYEFEFTRKSSPTKRFTIPKDGYFNLSVNDDIA